MGHTAEEVARFEREYADLAKTIAQRCRGHDDTRGYTPFMAAASAGDVTLVNKLLDQAPLQVNAVDPGMSNTTALHLAVCHENEDTVRCLLPRGADVNAPTTCGMTALHMAARSGYLGIIALLLEHGADVNVVQDTGFTPLDRALRNYRAEAARVLVNAGGRRGREKSTTDGDPA